MAEALNLAAIQTLNSWVVEMPDSLKEQEDLMKLIIHDLRKVVDLVNKKLGEGSSLNYFICDLVEIVHDVVNLKEIESHFLSTDMKSLQSWLREVLQLGVDRVERESESESIGEDVVVMDEVVKLLFERAIFHNFLGLGTYAITGMASIGKTTLARHVYNHAAVIDEFEPRVWVCASSESTHKELLIKIIQQVVDSEELQRDSLMEKMEVADNATLQQMLYQHLKGKKYLIVLDDFPERMYLNSILKALPSTGYIRCTLLLTSRINTRPMAVRNGYHVEPLDTDSSWELFSKTISRANKFMSEHEFPKKLEKKGREMLKKYCDGMPLAIKEVGRQLAEKKRDGGEWEQLVESIDFGSTLGFFELFYDSLVPKVKESFLHLACFKENTTMRAQKLEQILAAGGVLSHLEDLRKESIIIEVDKTRTHDHLKICRVNAVLHRLSIQKAGEGKVFEILRSSGNNRPSQSPPHRVIVCSRDKFNYSINNGNKHLVSLFFHGGGYLDASPSYWKSFELLKILDLEDFGLKSLPESIGTLIELRYLGLRNNYIRELPHSLKKLKKLEVLDIALNFMMEVADIIWEMGSLRHLYMSGVIFQSPLKIDALQNLKSLTHISVDNWTYYELAGLQMMTGIYTLGFEAMDGNSDVSKLFASLAELKNLYHLFLRGYRFRSMPCLDELGILNRVTNLKLDGLLPRLPSNFPPSICYLSLVNSCLDEDPMPLLVKLSKLYYLKLQNAYTGRQMVIVEDGFLELEILYMQELWNLRNVRVEKGAILSPGKLEIKNCPYLEPLPERFRKMIL